MELIVDGKPDFAYEGDPENLLDVLAAADAFLRDRQRAIIGVSVDGEAFEPDEVAERFQALKPSQVGTIAFTTRPFGDLVHEIIRDIELATQEMPGLCRALAVVFQSESPAEGFEPFTSLADIWLHVKEKQILLLEALDLPPSELMLDGKPFDQLHDELNAALNEAATAIEQRDTVLLADLLEYELAPLAEQESGIPAMLREYAPPAEKG